MNKRDKYIAIAESLEKADGPDREIDLEITLMGGFSYMPSMDRWLDEQHRVLLEPPHFTDSIDAMLTLLPQGSQYHIKSNEYEHSASVSITNNSKSYLCICATPCLALGAAIFRALADQEGK